MSRFGGLASPVLAVALVACAGAPPAAGGGVDRVCGCLRDEAGTTSSPAAETAPEAVAEAGEMTDTAAAAKRAFDRADWAKARPGLEAVAEGRTADDAGNRQIAAYHAAIASYQLGDFERAVAVFGAISRAPHHLKFRESLLWLVLLASEPRACAPASDAIARYDFEVAITRFENPATDAQRREARERYNLAMFSAGRGLYRRGEYEAARARLVMVDATSRSAIRARECLSFVDERLSAAAVASGASPPANPAPAEERAPALEVREGQLFVSKGNPAVADVLLPHEPIEERFGPDWHRTAVGKRIRVRGALRVHRCGPQEQCLLSGEIPILTPESIELLDAPAASGDPALLAKCLEECEHRSRACDKGAGADRGRLRICGSRRVKCRSDCRTMTPVQTGR